MRISDCSSDFFSSDLSIDAIGNDLHAVLTAVDARDAVLVGHSMGGMTIQSYAALHHEDFVARAKAVVLVATAARVLGRPVPARIIEALMGDQRADWSRRGWVGRATTQIGRAHVLTPVTNAHLVCRLLVETQKNQP